MNAQKLLAAYSAVLTGAVAVGLLTGTAPAPADASFEEIDVQRINIREPDGTLRMTLSGEKKLPGFIVAGTEYPQERTGAGMLFFNEDGTETGGLLFSGRRVDGRLRSSGSLTFDRYQQDQVVQILEREDGEDRFAGLLISDRPEGMLDFATLMKAKEAATPAERRALFRQANAGEAHRVIIARQNDQSSAVSLLDGNGRERLVLAVAEDGAASIRFLDDAGKVVRTIGPD